MAAEQRHFDSLIARRDTMMIRAKAKRDSVSAALAALEITSAAGVTPGRDSTVRKRTPVVAGAVPAIASGAAPPKAGGAVPPGQLPPTAPPKPIQTGNPMTLRALARGDSIARANANRMVGQQRNGQVSGDSVSGVVQLEGVPPAVRAILKTNDRMRVSLSGMATQDLKQVAGATVVVHGLRVSALDIVVRSFVVRSVKGMPAFDGRLENSGDTWSLTLSDGTGVKRLVEMPSAFKVAVGARVWVTMAPNGSTPANYGVIATR